MGIAHPENGVYLFNDMASPEDVETLVEFSGEFIRSGQARLPDVLQSRLEKRFDGAVMEKIPWRKTG